MATIHYKNLTIYEDNEARLGELNLTGFVILMLPKSAEVNIDIHGEMIQTALNIQTGVFLEPHQICRYLANYVLITDSYRASSEILKHETLRIGRHVIQMLPMAPSTGCIDILVNPRLPHIVRQPPPSLPTIQYARPLKIVIYGLTMFIWCQPHLVNKIFTHICEVSNVQFNRPDLTFSMLTVAHPSAIPDHGHVGVIRRSDDVTFMSIWPIWICVHPCTPDDLRALQPPCADLTGQGLVYNLYQEQTDDGGQGTSGTAGAIRSSQQRQIGYYVEEPADSASQGHEPQETPSDETLLLPSDDTVVLPTPSNEGSNAGNDSDSDMRAVDSQLRT